LSDDADVEFLDDDSIMELNDDDESDFEEENDTFSIVDYEEEEAEESDLWDDDEIIPLDGLKEPDQIDDEDIFAMLDDAHPAQDGPDTVPDEESESASEIEDPDFISDDDIFAMLDEDEPDSTADAVSTAHEDTVSATQSEESELISDDEIFAMLDADKPATPEDDEIVEITEFDEFFVEDDNHLLGAGGIADQPASTEEEPEFLEPIDIEEESQEDISQEPEEIGLDGPMGMDSDMDVPMVKPIGTPIDDPIGGLTDTPLGRSEELEIEEFMDDTMEEEIDLDSNFVSEFDDYPETEIESGEELLAGSTGSEEFEFEGDSNEISSEIDKLDTFLIDDEPTEIFKPPMSAGIMAGKAGLDSTSEDSPAGPSKADTGSAHKPGDSAIPKDLVDQAIEKLIREKFSEKIEGMMTEAIEKVVLKEITRLKTSLMEDADDNEL
jgi:hypothetical protein